MDSILGRKFIPVRVGRPWNGFPRAAVTAPGCLEVPKARLDGAWSSLGQWKVSLSMAGVGMGWALRSLPAQPGLFPVQLNRNQYPNFRSWNCCVEAGEREG